MYENYIITFKGLDLEGEFFDENTQFWLDDIQPTLVMFNHLQSLHPLGLRQEGKQLTYEEPPQELFAVGEIKSLEIDNKGIKAQYVLYDRLPEKYKDKFDWWSEQIEEEHKQWLELVRQKHDSGKLAFSSDSIKQLTQRETQSNGTTYIKSWPIPYVSLTHIPAEPRNNPNVDKLLVAEDSQESDYSKKADNQNKAAKFQSITYNGITVQATDRRDAANSNKKYERTVRYKGKERTVSYGDPNMRMRTTNDTARENFQSRHSCAEKRDPFSAGFWACYDWRDSKNTKGEIMEPKNKDKEQEEVKMEYPEQESDEKADMPVEDNDKAEMPEQDEEEKASDVAAVVEMLQEVLSMLKGQEKASDENEAMDSAESENETEVVSKFVGQIESLLEKFENQDEETMEQKNTGAGAYATNESKSFTSEFNINTLGGQKDDDPYRFTKAIRLLRDRPQSADKELKALGLVPGTSGGYTTQIQQSNELIDMLLAQSIFLRGGDAGRLVNYMPMQSDTMTIPVLTGGGTAYWVGENSEITSSDPTFEQRQLVAKKLAMLIPISNELLADNSVQLESKIRNTMVRIMRNSVDQAILYGSGSANQPLGVRSQGVNIEDINGQVTYSDLVGAVRRLEENNIELDETVAWVFNPAEKSTLRQIEDTNGHLIWTDTQYVTQTMAAQAASMLVGYPWVQSNNVIAGNDDNSATERDIFFGRWGGVIVGLRSDIEIKASDTAGTAFANDQTWIRAIMRVDVAMEHPENIEVLEGNSVG